MQNLALRHIILSFRNLQCLLENYNFLPHLLFQPTLPLISLLLLVGFNPAVEMIQMYEWVNVYVGWMRRSSHWSHWWIKPSWRNSGPRRTKCSLSSHALSRSALPLPLMSAVSELWLDVDRTSSSKDNWTSKFWPYYRLLLFTLGVFALGQHHVLCIVWTISFYMKQLISILLWRVVIMNAVI